MNPNIGSEALFPVTYCWWPVTRVKRTHDLEHSGKNDKTHSPRNVLE